MTKTKTKTRVRFLKTGGEAAIKLPDVGALLPKDNGEKIFVGDTVTLFDYDGGEVGEFEVTEAIEVTPAKARTAPARLAHEPGGGSGQGQPRNFGGGCVLSNGQTVKLRYLLRKQTA